MSTNQCQSVVMCQNSNELPTPHSPSSPPSPFPSPSETCQRQKVSIINNYKIVSLIQLVQHMNICKIVSNVELGYKMNMKNVDYVSCINGEVITVKSNYRAHVVTFSDFTQYCVLGIYDSNTGYIYY